MQKVSFLLVSLSFVIAPASYANAGLLSFLGSIFSKNDAAVAGEHSHDYVNSQGGALLQAAVNSNPRLPQGGGDITIVNDSALLSDVGPSGSAANIEEPSSKSDQLSIYVVRKGDSLSQIAKMFNVSVNTIIWANDIPRGGSIHEGETLVILPVSGIQHIVAKGETIKSIAQKYHGDEQEIIAYNDINANDGISVGATIIIPDGMLSVPVAPSTSTRAKAHGTGGPSYTGYYLRPVDGVLSQGLHGYNGVDLAAPNGTPIYASASGDVVVSKYRDGNPWFGGYGNYVVISHDNGTQTLYAHMSKVIVGEGWRVVKGQVIGYVGSTGRSTGAHLHFEVRGARNPFQ